MTQRIIPSLTGRRLPRLAILAGLLVLPALSAVADDGIYIETTNRSSGLTGETPREEVSKTYLSQGKMKIASTDPAGTDMILDPASATMTFLNHGAKEYYRINVKNVLDGMSQPGMEQMRAMMEDTKVSVVDTGEKKQIGSWNCKQYKVSKTGLMDVEQEIWATEEVDLDVTPFTEMMSLSGPDGLLGNSTAGEAQRAEMEKIKGYPILTKTSMEMMGSKMEMENQVTVIRKEPMPAGLFDIPADFKEKDMSPPKTEGAQP